MRAINRAESVIFGLIGGGIVGLIPVIVVAFLLSGILSSMEPNPKFVEESQKYHKEHVVPLLEKRDAFNQYIQNFLNSPYVSWALNALDERYLNYNIIEMLANYLKAGRADSLKEAINLYEEEQHRVRMETMQQETLEATERSATNTEKITKLSDESVANIKDIKKILKNL